MLMKVWIFTMNNYWVKSYLFKKLYNEGTENTGLAYFFLLNLVKWICVSKAVWKFVPY